MSTTQRIYVYLMVLLVIALGTLWHSNGKVSEVRELIAREKASLSEVMSVGQLVSDHQQLVAMQNSKIDSEKKGDLEMNNILALSKKHKLKDPTASTESLSVKRTFSEKVIALQLKDEKLKDLVLFMLDIEALGSAVVTKINVNRNPKNSDLWNADITVVQRIKKDEEV
jgi:hypothetical protein